VSRLLESFRIALRGLIANKARAALTMLGIIIGVAAVIALVSIGEGFSAYVSGEMEGLGTRTLFVFVNRGADNPQQLTTGDAEALADPMACPGIEAVAPTYQQGATATYAGIETSPNVSGVTPEYLTVQSYDMKVGRFIEQDDVDHRGRVAVLGSTPASDLFPGSAYPIGETIRLNDVPFEVVGVMAEKGSTGPMDNDDVVLIPLTSAQTRLFTADTVRGDYVVSSINVLVQSEDMLDSTIEDISAVLRERHRIQPGDTDDFQVANPSEMVEIATGITTTLTIFLGAIAAISLLVGGIGIMNIMLVSVTERTREIGLRKAVGAGKLDILWQFLIEAIAMSLIGGLLGIGLGTAISQIAGPALNVQALVSVNSVGLAFGFSAAVGVFFGIYPAMRAANLHPIDALRYE
jgi:putative ABC transport system permease protein